MSPVLGENLEDLHLAELECQRVVLHQTLHCSAGWCLMGRMRKFFMLSRRNDNLGTLMTSSGTGKSKALSTATSWSPSCAPPSCTTGKCKDLNVGKLLHGVRLDPLRWPSWLTQAGWPGTAGLFLEQLEELRLVEGGCPGTWPCSTSRTPPPGPVLSLTSRGVVLLPGQGHGDAQTLVRRSRRLRAALTLSTSIMTSIAEAVSKSAHKNWALSREMA